MTPSVDGIHPLALKKTAEKFKMSLAVKETSLIARSFGCFCGEEVSSCFFLYCSLHFNCCSILPA